MRRRTPKLMLQPFFLSSFQICVRHEAGVILGICLSVALMCLRAMGRFGRHGFGRLSDCVLPLRHSPILTCYFYMLKRATEAFSGRRRLYLLFKSPLHESMAGPVHFCRCLRL
ncbi:uncharacterized protein BJX67DRAFT_158626 [Aspergillus lucknowensis]|uniref:Secreted protein n=1 Tax=Aspergillus lucknowensis TaxID=176173 RepID=A0ABR4M3Z9_9EURO